MLTFAMKYKTTTTNNKKKEQKQLIRHQSLNKAIRQQNAATLQKNTTTPTLCRTKLREANASS